MQDWHTELGNSITVGFGHHKLLTNRDCSRQCLRAANPGDSCGSPRRAADDIRPAYFQSIGFLPESKFFVVGQMSAESKPNEKSRASSPAPRRLQTARQSKFFEPSRFRQSFFLVPGGKKTSPDDSGFDQIIFQRQPDQIVENRGLSRQTD